MIEMIKEILFSMKQNKLRTILTGFSVAWGIFMLIILLGSGQGLQNGITENMSNWMSRDKNVVTVYPNRTRLAYEGYASGRQLVFRYADLEWLKNSHPNIKTIAAHIYTSEEFKTDQRAITGGFLGYTMGGNNVRIVEGRYLSEPDIEKARKVAVVPEYVAENFYGDNKSAIGQHFTASSIRYTIIGVYESQNSWPQIYIPITTSLAVYQPQISRELQNLEIETQGIYNAPQSEEFQEEFRKILGAKYHFDPNDKAAVYMWDEISEVAETQLIFTSIDIFIWIIGLGTLLAGVVGVSNIMQVTVRERTNEFGIRKSMGATPISLIKLILVESIALTVVFGYIGLVGGAAVMEFISYLIDSGTFDSAGSLFSNSEEGMPSIFLNPTIDFGIAMWATVVLIIAGVVAGFIPARRAARLKTIDAMRHNK